MHLMILSHNKTFRKLFIIIITSFYFVLHRCADLGKNKMIDRLRYVH